MIWWWAGALFTFGVQVGLVDAKGWRANTWDKLLTVVLLSVPPVWPFTLGMIAGEALLSAGVSPMFKSETPGASAPPATEE